MAAALAISDAPGALDQISPGPSGHFRLIALLLLAYFAFTCFKLGASDVAVDEGRFGLSAMNILADYRQLAIVSEDPLGNPGTKPYLYPLAIAFSMTLLGKTELALRMVNVLALATAGLFLYGLAYNLIKDRSIAAVVLGVFLLNPGTLTYARCAMPEPFVVLAGCIALYAATKFGERLHVRWAVLCGLALGCGFLSKMWLVLPFVTACLLCWAVEYVRHRRQRFVLGSVVMLIVFLCASASHLFLVLWLAPAAFPYWKATYYIFSLRARAVGVGFDPVMWYRPWWFYLATLFKATFFGLPLLILGVSSIIRRRNAEIASILLASLGSLFVFSSLHVKQASYVFPIYPAMALLMASGFGELLRVTAQNELVLASLASIAASLFFYRLGVLHLHEGLAILALYLLYLVGAFQLSHRRFHFVGLVSTTAVAAMMFTGSVVVRQSLQHRTYYREIARYFKRQLQWKRPQDVVFIAPEFPAMEFYTFRTGEYWQTFYHNKDYADLVADLQNKDKIFCVVDGTGNLYGGKVSPDKIAALRMYTEDVTPNVERSIGHDISVQLFVPAEREALHH